jgi:glycosyltransferase involved in cell wall biosynthesis
MIDSPSPHIPDDPPLITAGITCFDAAETVADAIASARAQDWPNLEIVVVDDASADDSPAVIEEAVRGDGRARVVRHDRNRGYAGALNTIVGAAAGEFVAIFDDDDVSAPDRISRQWRRLVGVERRTGESLVFCYSDRDVRDRRIDGPPGRVTAIGRTPPEPAGTAVVDFLLWHYEDPEHSWGQFGSCTLMARKRSFRAVGPFDETFRRGAEWDLAIRAAFLGGRFAAVDEPLGTQYITPGADKAGSLPLRSVLNLRRKYRNYLKGRGVYRASIAMAYARHHYARNKPALSRIWLAAACALSPGTVLPNEWRKWRRRRERVDRGAE